MPDVGTEAQVSTVVGHLFTGTAADAVIAILLIVVTAMGFVIWYFHKRAETHEAKLTKLTEDHKTELEKLTRQYHTTLREVSENSTEFIEKMNNNYVEVLNRIHEQYSDNTEKITEALHGVQLTMGEVKTLVSIASTRGHGNGTS